MPWLLKSRTPPRPLVRAIFQWASRARRNRISDWPAMASPLTRGMSWSHSFEHRDPFREESACQPGLVRRGQPARRPTGGSSALSQHGQSPASDDTGPLVAIIAPVELLSLLDNENPRARDPGRELLRSAKRWPERQRRLKGLIERRLEREGTKRKEIRRRLGWAERSG
jgi:hypothetical protein